MKAMVAAVLVAAITAEFTQTKIPILRCQSNRKCQYIDGSKDHFRYDVDGHQITIACDVDSLKIDCNGSSILESYELPQADSLTTIFNVELVNCPLPVNNSIADVLSDINVTLNCYVELDTPGGHSKLTISNLVAAPTLNAKHFIGLECLYDLKIVGDEYLYPKPDRNFLAPLQGLRYLEMSRIVLHAGDLETLATLRELNLHDIQNLQWLPMTSTLESIRIHDWMAKRLILPRQRRCDSLRELYLKRVSLKTLPDGWLANCSHLEVIEIEKAHSLTTLPSNLLIGTSVLNRITIVDTGLELLPERLLDHSPKLHNLILENNKLRTLSKGTFDKTTQLNELSLNYNNLDTVSMSALTPLANLTSFSITGNTGIADICDLHGYSPLRNSIYMEKLDLDRTNISRICHDWRNFKYLRKLDLSVTNLTRLTFDDLLFTPMRRLDISLYSAPITAVEISRLNYTQAVRNLSKNIHVDIWPNYPLPFHCDCRMYWTRRALDLDVPLLQYFGKVRCRNGQHLVEVSAEDMTCMRPEECLSAALPTGCQCSVRPDADTEHATLLVRADCRRLGLTRVPRPRAPSAAARPGPADTRRVYELRLAHNNISVIHPDDVQDNIQGLDLRHNQVTAVSAAAAERLGAVRGVLRLAGNPLECSCRAAPLLRALTARPAELTDHSEATCDDGSVFYSTPFEQCGVLLSSTGWLAITLGVALALVLVAAVSLSTHERRFFLRVLLHRWGFDWRTAEPKEDDARRYDAFVTFSHKDKAVVCELIARLEPRYRLCVHTRDWIPGRLIAEQMSESVSNSRRTLALVSRHFLASGWACAEFHEAHAQAMLDAEPRLIVILLEEPSGLQMIRQLKRYVSSRTYLLRNDPWFWDKLEVALPKPRDLPPVDHFGSSSVDLSVAYQTLLNQQNRQ